MTRADRFTAQSKAAQVYSDFLTDLDVHPGSGDVVRYINEKAVIRSIRNLLLTNKGERFCQLTIGSSINTLLFEPMGTSIANELQSAILAVINTFEPRAKVLNIQVIPDYDNESYVVNFTIMILNQQNTTTFSVNLTKVR